MFPAIDKGIYKKPVTKMWVLATKVADNNMRHVALEEREVVP